MKRDRVLLSAILFSAIWHLFWLSALTVVVVPKERVEQVAEVATRIEDAEDRIRAAVERGERLDLARKNQGYHVLQTKDVQ